MRLDREGQLRPIPNKEIAKPLSFSPPVLESSRNNGSGRRKPDVEPGKNLPCLALTIKTRPFDRKSQVQCRMPPEPNELTLQVAQWVPQTEAEGPGRRFALWLQGCPLRCPGCCNPQMLPFEGGTAMRVDDLVQLIARAQAEHGVEGLTLIGGEPTAQAPSAAALARATCALGLSVMMFTGHTLEELSSRACPDINDLLAHCDLVVDGPYDQTQPDTTRRWIGSTNQRIHCLSSRYQADDPCWREPDTLEIRWQNGTLSVNGFPSRSAVGLWKRPRSLRPAPTEKEPEP